MKNALIINGKVYQAKRMLYIGIGTGPCDKCDLRRKCEAKNFNPCDVFNTEGGNRLAYFKKTRRASPPRRRPSTSPKQSETLTFKIQ